MFGWLDSMKKRDMWFFLALMAVACFLRLYGLDKESLWLDEAVNVQVAHDSLLKILQGSELAHPPLFYILMHLWIQGFGDSEFSVRFLPCLFGSITVGLAFLGARAFFGFGIALFFSTLVAVSPFHIAYSQEARMYSLVGLLGLCSMFSFWSFGRDPSRRNASAYVISSVLLLYTHYYGFFLIIAQNAIVLSYSLKKPPLPLKIWFKLQIILIGLFIPYTPLLVYGAMFMRKNGILSYLATFDMPGTFLAFCGGGLLTKMFLVLTAFGIAHCLKKEKGLSKIFRDLFIWLLVPVFAAAIFSWLLFPIYGVRYLIYSSFALYLLTAIGILTWNARWGAALLTLLALLHVPVLDHYYRQYHKEQWRDAARYVEDRVLSGDFVSIQASYCEVPFKYYFKNKDVPIVKIEEETQGFPVQDIAQYRRVWYIRSHAPRLGLEKLRSKYPVIEEKQFIGVEVNLLDLHP